MMSIGLHCRLVGRPGRAAAPRALRRLRPGPRQGLDRPPHRHRPPLARAPPLRRRRRCARPRMAQDGVRRALRRRLRAFALDRRARLRARARAGARHRRRPRTTRSAAPSAAPRRRNASACSQAHPDLAGKLAAARRLTAESDRRAGLRRARRADRRRARRFTAAQRRLRRAKFGFPFIIAVRGRTKADILAAFETPARQRPRRRVRHRLRRRSSASRSSG